MKNKKRDSLLYSYRYAISFVILGLLAAILHVYNFWNLPLGLSVSEMKSATISSGLSIATIFSNTPDYVANFINLPWNLIQSISVDIFGFNTFALRLPAVLMTLATIAFFTIIIRRLSNKRLALVGGLLAVFSSYMLSMSHSGTGEIMTTMIITIILLSGQSIINSKNYRNFYLIIIAISSGLLSYMNGGIYILISLLVVSLLHPRSRLMMARNKIRIIKLLLIFEIIVLPMQAAVIIETFNGNYGLLDKLFLIGLPTYPNLTQFVNSYFGLYVPVLNNIPVTMLSITSFIMLSIGLIVLAFRHKSSIRFYTIALTILTGTILSICNPQLTYILYIPSLVLVLVCIDYLINRWLEIFPINPYGKVFATIPLGILVLSLCFMDGARYFNNINYNPHIAYHYNQTLPEINHSISQNKSLSYSIVVPNDQLSFYRALHSNKNVRVYSDTQLRDDQRRDKLNEDSDRIIIIKGSKSRLSSDWVTERIYNDWHKNDSFLFTSYKKK